MGTDNIDNPEMPVPFFVLMEDRVNVFNYLVWRNKGRVGGKGQSLLLRP